MCLKKFFIDYPILAFLFFYKQTFKYHKIAFQSCVCALNINIALRTEQNPLPWSIRILCGIIQNITNF